MKNNRLVRGLVLLADVADRIRNRIFPPSFAHLYQTRGEAVRDFMDALDMYIECKPDDPTRKVCRMTLENAAAKLTGPFREPEL